KHSYTFCYGKKKSRKELSQEQRSRIIGGYLYGSEHSNKRPSPQEVLSMRDKCSLVRIANQNRKAPLAIISNELNALERKKWCRKHLKWINEWQMVIFSNESRFCLHKSDGRERTWRRVNEKYHRDCINTTVKFNGGSVMFWGCFSWWGVGPLVEIEGNMDSDSYVNILANHFIPWANSLMKKYPNEIKLIFQQDLAPIHSSIYTKWWMNTHNFDVLDWVPYSPDLNLIENLWECLDSAVCNRKPTSTKREELVRVVKEEWNKIQIEYLHSLICNISDRTKTIYKANGWHSKY
ncbi:8637_t:CDS:2, partial [Gigaspora margarita]